ncbi:alpha-hydroxy-acid oxidizing protein [Caballeronia mineralivorans]|uniref:alpha-hydroxy-acid oxidizing protein n=1 Tax=Caballeronia mineralivorans TaxID=2010198 RepID=UPI00094FC971
MHSVVEACPDPSVMIDGGIRRASDVLKALAFDARAVFVGRSFAHVASVAGRAGITRDGFRRYRQSISPERTSHAQNGRTRARRACLRSI